MGKTKTKIIDDSVQEESKKKTSKKFSEKVIEPAKVNKPAASEAMLGADSRLSEAGEIRGESTSSDVHEQDGAGSEQSEEAELENQEQVSKRSSKSPKQGKSKPRSKKYQVVVKDLDRSATYSIDEAVDKVKKLSYSKFNGSLEAHIVTAQTGVRGLVSLPFASGRKIRVLAFGKTAAESGADIFGDDAILSEIEKGKINFDILVTTPEWMPKLAKAAKILGPKGLIPSPKNGTITEDLKKAVTEFHSGKTEYKTEAKSPVIHLSLGKLNQPTEELSANIRLLLQTLGKSRIIKVNLSPTMGPSVKLNLSSL